MTPALAGALAYFCGLVCLALIAARLSRRLIESATASWRLASVLVGVWIVNATIVQWLGVAGVLRPATWIGTVVALAVAASIGRNADGSFGVSSAPRDLVDWSVGVLAEWSRGRTAALTAVGVMTLLLLTLRSSWVFGVDSMNLHGPIIAEWIQSGSIRLFWDWNYPFGEEYQFLPPMMLTGGDSLVAVPRLLEGVLLLLLVREIGRRLGVPAGVARLLAWLFCLSPMIWGNFGEQLMKNDRAAGVGLLLTFLALDEVWKRRPSAPWIFTAGAFMLLATKSSGVFLLTALAGLGVALWLWRRHRTDGLPNVDWAETARRVALGAPLVALVLATPLALPLNVWRLTGNPFHPIQTSLGGFVLFEGPGDFSGLALVNHLHAGLAAIMARSLSVRVGLEAPVLVALALLTAVVLGVPWLRRQWRTHRLGRRPHDTDRADASRATPPEPPPEPDPDPTRWIGWMVLCLALALFFITPWSAGTRRDALGYITGGYSYRYILGALALAYPLGAAVLGRLLRWRTVERVVEWLFCLLLYLKWSKLGSMERLVRTEGPTLLFFVGGVVALVALRRLVLWTTTARAPGGAPLASSRSLRVGAVLTALVLLAGATHAYMGWTDRTHTWRWSRSPLFVRGYSPIWKYIQHLEEPVRIGVTKRASYRYFLYGPDLQNELVTIDGGLWPRLPLSTTDLDYLYTTREPVPEKHRAAYMEQIARLRQQGWKPVARHPKGLSVLLAAPDRGPDGEPPAQR